MTSRTTLSTALPRSARRPVTSWLIGMAMVVLLLLPGGTTALASQPAAANGTLIVTEITGFSPSPAGANLIIQQTTEGVSTGSLTGVFVDELKAVLHPNGKIGAQGTITCICTVDGRSGTLTLVQTTLGSAFSQTFDGHAVIIGGTGDLSGLHGTFELQGTVDANGLATITYSGQIHFDR